ASLARRRHNHAPAHRTIYFSHTQRRSRDRECVEGYAVNIARQQTIEYLRAPADAEWRWADNASAIVWRDGSTIAFREEISQILEWLAPNGLPPFGSIVHLLAATRGRIPSPNTLIYQPAKRAPGQT